MAESTFDDYVIEQFTLEEKHFKELADLITKSFLNDEAAQQEGATIMFSEETFRTFFGPPSIDRELFIRAIDKSTNELVGFLGIIPRKLRIEDITYHFVVPAWLAVHPKHQRKGLATELGYNLFKIFKDKGYDGAFGLFEPSQHGLDTSKAVMRRANIPIHKIVKIEKFMVRVFDADAIAEVIKLRWFEKLFFKLKTKIRSVNNSNIRLYKSEDYDQIVKLVAELTARNQVSIIPNPDDLKWVLNRPNVLCIVHENDNKEIDGFIYSWEFLFAGFGNAHPFGWLETIHTYNLHRKQIKDMAILLCIKAKELGWKGLQTPYIPYFNPKPFKKANFIFFGQKMSLDLAPFKDVKLPEKIDSFYFDWR